MARVEIDFAERELTFRVDLAVRTGDINGAAHLGNDGMVSMLSEARAAFLAHQGFDENGAGSVGIIVTDLATVFQRESFYGDMLRFDVGLTDINRYGGDFVFRVTRIADGADIARAKYGFVFFDYSSRKVTPWPESVRKQFGL